MGLTLKLDDIKPLLGAVGLGQDPTPAPKNVSNIAPPPMPPPPTPAQAGFSLWNADPKNQQVIANSLTMPGTPIAPNNTPPASPLSPSPTPPPAQPLKPYNPMASVQPLAPPPSASPMPQASNPPNVGTPAMPNVQPLNLKNWEASNPDQVAKPQLEGQGWKGFLKYGIPAALMSAGSGLSDMGRGDPTAGFKLLGQQTAYDRGVPELNQSRYNAAVIQPEKEAAAVADTQSQTAQRAALANKANAQADNVGDPTKQKAKDIADAAKLGSVPVYDDKGNLTGYAPDEKSTVFQKNQALEQLQQARTDYASAQADLAKSKNDPKSPLYQQAQARIRTAQQNAATAAGRLNLSGQEFGFNQEKFFNPQPTAAERGKGDLAQSAVERVAEMKAIVAKHPDIFGPVAGRAQNAQVWLGSQDPDAQTYQSAAQYLSDHSAGVFGGRGKYITEQLHGLTDPHSNPAALNAALDEAEKAAQGFVAAGTVHGKGQTGSAAAKGGGITPPPSGGIQVGQQVKLKNGQTITVKAVHPDGSFE